MDKKEERQSLELNLMEKEGFFAPIEPPQPELQVWERQDFNYICFGGFYLAAIAGFINCCIFLKYSVTVSHSTGTTTKMSTSFSILDFSNAFYNLFLLFCFFCGCTFVGFTLSKEKFHYSRKYGLIMLVESILLFAAIYMFKHHEGLDYSAMCFASVSMGIHNSLFTNFSGAVVRTTHVTGIITDIGLIIGHFIRGKDQSKDLWRLRVLVPLYVGFICGGIIGGLMFQMFEMSCLYIPFTALFTTSIIWTLWRVLYKHSSDLQIERLTSNIKRV